MITGFDCPLCGAEDAVTVFVRATGRELDPEICERGCACALTSIQVARIERDAIERAKERSV